MITPSHPWISRHTAETIYDKIKEEKQKPKGVQVYLLTAPAGMGKTYLTRDIGVRLGSESGYEPGHSGGIYWSGIIDLYDPDTNGKRIEQHWIDAFGSLDGFEFDEYQHKREFYDHSALEVALPSELERQVGEIRTAFADGMKKSIEKRYPVMAFDTVERLQTILDPAQKKLNLQAIDPPDVLVWLLHQVAFLSYGVILLVGRPAPLLQDELQSKIDNINLERKRRDLAPIVFTPLSVERLTSAEQKIFFEYRCKERPELENLLNEQLKSLLNAQTGGNPLLLDIALETLWETKKPDDVVKALETTKGIEAVEDALLGAYMNSGTSERKNLLAHLAVARNGLYDDLLKHLDGANFPELLEELHQMEKLPFIKVRDFPSDQGGDAKQHTYFLHDEMYAICDRVGIIPIEQVREDSGKIAVWFDNQIEIRAQATNSVKAQRRSEAVKDLLIESLPYRMRSKPQETYQWFLVEADQAIRSAERGLDLRLQASMAQFMSSASEEKQEPGLPTNAIDQQILIMDAPELCDDFVIDSTLLWLKRYSVRGNHKQALEIAQKAPWMEEAYVRKPEHYLTTYAEFLLWKGQSQTYTGNSIESLATYDLALKHLATQFPFDALKHQVELKAIPKTTLARICLVAGRLYNNRGYVYWYQGKYWLAIDEFKEALRYFELVHLVEEIANSKDNLGRVYATLGYNFQAFEQIGDGLKLRIAAGSPYREALSRNSLAIIYFRFNNAPRALEEVKTALEIFERFEVERGIGLAHFTRGVAYRRLTREVESWQNPILIKDQAIGYLEHAETDLRRALKIFSENVQEPIRKIQIYNELACVYRARYVLFKSNNDQRQEGAFDRSKRHFDQAIDLAKEGGFPIPGLDSIQDRAVLFDYAGQYDNAREDIKESCRLIPEQYQIKEGYGLPSLNDSEQRVDAYYRLMGQVEELVAAIVYEEALQGPEKMMQTNLLNMLEHYTLASAYFNEFSSEAFLQQQTHSHIYTKLRSAPQEFILDIRKKHLPVCLKKYNLPPKTTELIRSQFDGIFNALILGSKNRFQPSRP